MKNQKKLLFISTTLLLFGCAGKSWAKVDETGAYEIRSRILDNVEIPDYINMSKKYSRVEEYGASTKKYEYSGPRLQISKNDFYIKNVLFQPDEWNPEEGEKPYYILFTQYHILRGNTIWLLNDAGGIRSKTPTIKPSEEEAKNQMLLYMENDVKFTLQVNFDYDVWLVNKMIEKHQDSPDEYDGSIVFKHLNNDAKSLSCEYSYVQPGGTAVTEALRASNKRIWKNGYHTYEKGHYEGIDYDKLGYEYEYVEDAEYKAQYNKSFTIDDVDPETWC